MDREIKNKFHLHVYTYSILYIRGLIRRVVHTIWYSSLIEITTKIK